MGREQAGQSPEQEETVIADERLGETPLDPEEVRSDLKGFQASAGESILEGPVTQAAVRSAYEGLVNTPGYQEWLESPMGLEDVLTGRAPLKVLSSTSEEGTAMSGAADVLAGRAAGALLTDEQKERVEDELAKPIGAADVLTGRAGAKVLAGTSEESAAIRSGAADVLAGGAAKALLTDEHKEKVEDELAKPIEVADVLTGRVGWKILYRLNKLD